MLLDDAILAAFAAGMAVTTAILIKWAASARTPLRQGTVVFLLLMMAGMLAGALTYALSPGTTGAVAGLWIASAVMSASVAVVFAAFLAETRAALAAPERPARPWLRLGFVAVVVALALLNEILMGWTFDLFAGNLAAGGSLLGTLGSVVVSPWFVFTMAGEMALTAFFLRDRLTRPVYIVLLSQAALMFLSPPVLDAAWWQAGSIDLSSIAMIVLFVFLMEFLYRNRTFANGFATYLVRLLPIYGLMMAGVFVWQVYGNVGPFALAVVLEMVVFFEAIVRVEKFEAPSGFSWQLKAFWTFQVLFWVFVSELFMGAVLAAQLSPARYLPAIPSLPLAGSAWVVVQDAVSNGFYFFANTTATTWFLVMMGVEMGALVAFKMKEVKGRELRARLAIMLGAYGAFAVFYPSVYYGLVFPNGPGAADPTTVPVLGWSMGIGSAPLAVGVFGVLLATYAILGAVTILFGRRVVCSVFCTAAVMYQGTTVDAMKSFNRTSPAARKFLGSRFSAAYSVTNATVLVALAGTSLLSYFDSVGTLNVTVGGADPSVFLFVLSFSVLWYVLFVTIPYAGNYNCVTMGWCYTGQISAAFSRIGFFGLRVKDKEVCRRCTTLDCAKACPVGLVDMPGHFRTKGQFRSAKCCGVGGCAEACPYGNLYLSDVRHWVRRWLDRSRSPPVGARLPMAGSPRPATTTATTAAGASARAAPARP
jgi:polyferredoxin